MLSILVRCQNANTKNKAIIQKEIMVKIYNSTIHQPIRVSFVQENSQAGLLT